MANNISSKKYQDIKKKGKELFWKYGTKRVTVEEICREAGVSKMTYYKFFKNKNEQSCLTIPLESCSSRKRKTK